METRHQTLEERTTLVETSSKNSFRNWPAPKNTFSEPLISPRSENAENYASSSQESVGEYLEGMEETSFGLTSSVENCEVPCQKGSNGEELANFLNNSNLDKLSVNDLDCVVLVLQRQRELKAAQDQVWNRQVTVNFLEQLSSIKRANTEVDLIQNDLHKLSTEAERVDVVTPSGSSSYSYVFSNGDVGLVSEAAQRSFSVRNQRMENHFEELTQLYFSTRNSAEAENSESLNEFGSIMSHVTQYNGLKTLATLRYVAEDVSSLWQPSMSSLHQPSAIVTSIAFDKDSEFFAIAGVTNKIKLFEYVSMIGTPERMVWNSKAELNVHSPMSCVAWNGFYKNRLASADYSGYVTLWDACVGERIRDFAVHEEQTWSVDWNPGNPNIIASGSEDTTVRLWSVNSLMPVGSIKMQESVGGVKFLPGLSSYSVAFGSTYNCVYMYDFRNLKEALGVLYGHKKRVNYVKFPSSNTNSTDELLSASLDGSLRLWNLKGEGPDDKGWMRCKRSFKGHVNSKHFLGLDTDGNYIACGSEDNSLFIYYKLLPKPLFSFKFENNGSPISLNEGSRTSEMRRGAFVSAVAWRRDSPVVVAANSEGIVKVLQLA